MGATRAVALCQCFNGALEFQAGHWVEAEAALRESIRLHRELQASSGEALAWQRLGMLQTARGRLEEAMRSFHEGVAVAERSLMRAHCLARLYASMTRNRLAAGDVQAAGQYLALGMAMAERHGNCATCHSLLLPAGVSVCIAQGDLGAAEALCARFDADAGRYASGLWLAMARQSRAELAAARGELDRARAWYEEARAAYAEAGNEYEAGRCLAAVAEVLRNQGQAQGAAEARRQAEAAFEHLGAIG